MFKKLFISLSLLFTCQVQAGIIEYNGYSRDEASNIVTGRGLEWLMWDTTAWMSIDSALAAYSADGWRLAGNSDMANLFNDFGFRSTPFTDSENERQSSSLPWNVAENKNNPRSAFTSLFWPTLLNLSLCGSNITVSCYSKDDPHIRAMAFFGSDTDGDGLYNLAQAYDDYTLYGPNLRKTILSPASSELSDDRWDRQASVLAGVALVRDILAPPTAAVPEPITFMLFVSALLSLGARRHRKKSA